MLETANKNQNQPVTPASSVLYGWRFAHADGSIDDVREMTPQEIGVLHSVPLHDAQGQPISPLWLLHGFHASLDPLDALASGSGFYVERVKLSGTIAVGDWSAGASERTILWRADARRVVAAFCTDCAERAFDYLVKNGMEPTRQTAGHIELSRAYLDGKTTESVMAALTRPPRYTKNVSRAVSSTEQVALHAASLFGAGDDGDDDDDDDNDDDDNDDDDFVTASCALEDAAEAMRHVAEAIALAEPGVNADSAQARADGVYRGARVWQADRLHERLMALAPMGYEEKNEENTRA